MGLLTQDEFRSGFITKPMKNDTTYSYLAVMNDVSILTTSFSRLMKSCFGTRFSKQSHVGYGKEVRVVLDTVFLPSCWMVKALHAKLIVTLTNFW